MKNLNKKYFGLFVKLVTNPAMLVMSKDAGLDFLFYDNEHNSFSKSKLHDLFLFGNNIGLPSFIRVSELSRREIGQALDNGAVGIMVPMIETKEQAERLVEFSKYPPIGLRGYSSGAHTNYGPSGNHQGNMELKNKTVVTIAQIETERGVKNAEEILETPGIDACIIGPVDLSISLGVTDNIMDKKELETITKVISVSKKLNKPVGIIGANEILEYFKDDLNYFISANDLSILRSGLHNAVAKYKEITK
ncbi:HpcH/HpaI aldolase/citrate lyase family protein [Bulleidia sp. zg-1006]|uniref:HpcH/HpaI aldolase family protein n=1 Tax=Bulleidia sp. zg-1006 TaxID=2806552 RepID=UPI00193AB3E0|nr:aldolase/citrate lyase family protein [Bulleidia sp. zg-1006]QRG86951.1 2,4-dihydroxyhept-2-ene-1,7-dioic acid aldolase [Bulleidia sp. zg-1006]